MDAERAAKALAAPAQRGRSRANRGDNPKPPGQQDQQPEQKPRTPPTESADPGVDTTTTATPAQDSEQAVSVAPAPAAPAATAPEPKSAPALTASPRKPEAKPRPQPSSSSKSAGPIDAARARLAARTAEQTFLPLVSRIAKLNDWIGQARMAVTDAKVAGVIGEHLEDTLRGIARKNGTSYTDIPESVRAAIDAEDIASDPTDAARARLAARTAEQTFLPLVSRIAKLRDWVQQAELAIEDAKANGVEAEHIEDTLRGIARKNGITYTDIPESVRTTIAAD